MSDPLEARQANPHPMGKCDIPLEISLYEALNERLTTMAAIKGIPKATYSRQILERAMFGEFHMMQIFAKQAGE